jgi:undecaprenyl-diphosphatase
LGKGEITVEGFNDYIYSLAALTISPGMTIIMKFISNMGEWFVYTPLALLLLFLPKTRFNVGIPAATVLLISAILNPLLKQLFHIPRPDINQLVNVTGFGFPSGHAMNGMAFVGICAYLFCRYSNKRGAKSFITLASVLYLLLIGFSRLYLGVHSATDVIGGYFFGVVIVSAAIMIINAKELRAKRRKSGVVKWT